MNEILSRYLPRIDFDSYEDFFENYRVNVPDNFNFGFDVVDEWARIAPGKRALVWCDDNFEPRTYTFEDARRLSNKAANLFVKLGIKKGDVVMLILKQRPLVWWCLTALCKIGAVCIPGTFQLKPKDMEYRCNAASIKMILSVADESVINCVNESRAKCKTLETVAYADNFSSGKDIDFLAEMEKMSDEFERPSGPEATKSTDTMLIYFSSGTTGMPKMALHDHTLPLGHIVTAKYWQKVQDDTIHLTQTDSGWAKFAWGKIYGQWICGAAVGAYDTDKFAPDMLIRAVELIRPTTFCATVTIYRYLIKEDLSGVDFSFIKHGSTAGEPLNPEVFNQIEAKLGLKLHEGFGQSETSVLLANFGWFDVKPGSTGKPAPLYNIKLIGENGRETDDGVNGTICVTGTDKKHPTGLFKEYYRDEQTTENCWSGGVYDTGDVAWRDSDGYYWFVGRNDDVIKCSGYRIGPFEVESALLEHPCVLECAVTAVADPMRGQVVKATVVLAKGFAASDELTKELQKHVKKVTAPYKYPRIIEYVNALPKTISGKIRRTEIRQKDNG